MRTRPWLILLLLTPIAMADPIATEVKDEIPEDIAKVVCPTGASPEQIANNWTAFQRATSEWIFKLENKLPRYFVPEVEQLCRIDRWPAAKECVRRIREHMFEKLKMSSFDSSKAKIPKFFEDPDFMKLVGPRNKRDEIQKYIEERNKTLPKDEQCHSFAFTGTIDSFPVACPEGRQYTKNTKERLAVVCPGAGGKVTWTALVYRDSDQQEAEHGPVNNISVVEEVPEGDKVVAYYSDTTICKSNPKKFHPSGAFPMCQLCHFNGVLVPDANKVADKDRESFRKAFGLKKELVHTRAGDGSLFDPEARGPGVGPWLEGDEAKTKRPDAFIKGCFASAVGVTQDSVQRVRTAMSCGRCHTGEMNHDTGYATAARLPALIGRNIVLVSAIRSGRMPHKEGAKLSEAERGALEKCLRAESGEGSDELMRKSALYHWLTGIDCKSGKPVETPAGAPAVSR